MPDVIERAAIWKRLAALYFGGGYLIDLAVSEPRKHGGYFHGTIALAHLAVVVLYFIEAAAFQPRKMEQRSVAT